MHQTWYQHRHGTLGSKILSIHACPCWCHATVTATVLRLTINSWKYSKNERKTTQVIVRSNPISDHRCVTSVACINLVVGLRGVHSSHKIENNNRLQTKWHLTCLTSPCFKSSTGLPLAIKAQRTNPLPGSKAYKSPLRTRRGRFSPVW